MSKVRKVWLAWNGYGETPIAGDEGPDVIHIEMVGLGCGHTLCGHVDRNEFEICETDKKPTCPICLSIWNGIKEGEL